jgi:hypothetical protein
LEGDTHEYLVCPTDRHSDRSGFGDHRLHKRFESLTELREARVFSAKSWEEWVSLNGNNLVWIALTIGGILFTSLLMKI